MAAIPYNVAHAFKRGEAARQGNFYSTGDAIYSYGMKLAHLEDRGGCGKIIILDYLPRANGGKAPSVTTARHMAALEGVLDFEHEYMSSFGVYGGFAA